MRIEVHNDVQSAEAAAVDAGLEASNAARAPLHEVRGLACFTRSTAGEVVGGAVGRTWGACCELQQLWVSPEYRRQGLGCALVKAFERAAQARGCHTFYLTTFSFQAPELYQSLGYSIAASIEGFAPGVTKFLMVRK
jgi:ribosomal protein S18 acetylase RimI-like enzyme